MDEKNLKALEYHKQELKNVRESEYRIGEGRAYCNLGITYQSLGDFK